MSRDKSLLKNVSDLFTEETLKQIVVKATGKNEANNVEILSWKFGEANVKGDSNLSTTNKIKIEAKIDGEPRDVKIFVKSLPKNIGRRKTVRSPEFFYNEIVFYRVIVPKFEDFINQKNMPLLMCVPKCLAFVSDGENDFLALDDAGNYGFGRIPRDDCVDFQTCCSMLNTMAEFHAISYAFKDQNPEQFAKMAASLRETYYTKRHWEWYKKFQNITTRVSKDALAREYPNSAVEKRFNSLGVDELFNRNVDFCSRQKAATSVILQGDCWAPNFLVRDLPGNEKQVMILDFQLARCASPVTDISFMFYSCTDKAMRDANYEKLLKVYHDKLKKSILELGSDPEKVYSWDTFMKEVKEQAVYGIHFAMEALPWCALPNTEAYDLDEIIKGDDAMDISEVWPLPNIEDKKGRRRLANIIAFAYEKGYL